MINLKLLEAIEGFCFIALYLQLFTIAMDFWLPGEQFGLFMTVVIVTFAVPAILVGAVYGYMTREVLT